MGDKLEIERKFLVEMPNLRKLKAKFDVIKADISQTYLTSEGNGVERRNRQSCNVWFTGCYSSALNQ